MGYMHMTNSRKKMMVARILVGMVLFFNLQCAIAFLIAPDRYSPGFEVVGVVGRNIVRGFGVLFIMWNVPYILAFINPDRYKVSLIEALFMQGLGFFGESVLRLTLTPGHTFIESTVDRFIVFDGLGLVALFIAAWMVHRSRQAAQR
jgi:hypothetical protein